MINISNCRIESIDLQADGAAVMACTKYPGGSSGPAVELLDAAIDATQATYSSNDKDSTSIGREGHVLIVTTGGISADKAFTLLARRVKGDT